MAAAADFFTAAEKEAIARTIGEVEKQTSGELVVLLTEASDRYPEGPILAGIGLGSLIALAITDLFFHDSLWVFLPLDVSAAVLVGLLVGRFPRLKRLFVAKVRMDEEVAQRALQVFYEKGLHRTRDATGVLFFISLMEHRAWVLADQGIYRKISQEALAEYAAGLAVGIRQGQAASALCREITKIGEVLARHFPRRDDDTNELADQVGTV